MPAATNTKGLTICISKGDASPAVLIPTAISKAKPAIVTVADVGALAVGDMAAPVGTGFPTLDGKLFVVGELGTGTFELMGSDTTNDTGSLGTSPKINVNGSGDMVCECFSEFSINRDAPEAIEAGTFCDPTLTVASAVAPAGTFEFTGNVNKDDPGYAELLKAEEDGLQREMRVTFPQGNGYVVAPVTVTLVSWAFALDTSVQFTGAGTFNSKPKHVYDDSGAVSALMGHNGGPTMAGDQARAPGNMPPPAAMPRPTGQAPAAAPR